MNKDLTTSDLHRKNILNNNYALEVIYNEVKFPGILFEDEFRFTKKQVAEFYEIDERTVDRYIENNKSEFEESGYEVLTGNRLKTFKLAYVSDIDVANIEKTVKKAPSLGVFTFRAFLNIGMLLTESEKAKNSKLVIMQEGKIVKVKPK